MTHMTFKRGLWKSSFTILFWSSMILRDGRCSHVRRPTPLQPDRCAFPHRVLLRSRRWTGSKYLVYVLKKNK